MNYFDNTEITIEDRIIFDVKHNVQSVTTNIHTCDKTYELYNEPVHNDPYIFLLFECPFHMAFGHWVLESAIFLPYFKYFPNVRLLVNKNPHRDYKKLFFKLFNIDNISYIDNNENCSAEYKNIPKNNICIISRNFTQNDKEHKARDPVSFQLYTTLIMNFRKQILANKFDYIKDIDHLFLPRNNTQNYIPNDRYVDYTPIKKLLSDKEYTEYKTSDTIDLNDQIKLLSRSKNIYLDWGSNFSVNGLFSKGSTIYCVNRMPHQLDYPFGSFIINLIESENTVKYL